MAVARLLPFAMAGVLAACAVGPNTSYVSAVATPADVSVIASGIAGFMRTQLPAPSTTLVLDPTPSDQADNALTPVLADSLRQQGFALTRTAAPGDAHTLRYWVTTLDGSGALVRLQIDRRTAASRFFVRNSAGGLQSGGPFTVMTMEASR